MAVRFERPVSRAAFVGKHLGLLAFLLFIAAFLAFRFGPLTAPDFAMLALVAAAIGAMAALFAAIGLSRLWQVGALGGVASFKALVYAAVPLSLVAFAAFAYLVAPPVYDVSTDPDEPPKLLKTRQDDQQWLPRDVTPENAEAGTEAYAELVGKRYDGGADRVLAAVRRVAKSMRIVIVASEGDELAVLDNDGGPAAVEDRAAPVIPVPLPRPSLLLQPPVVIGSPGDVLLQGGMRTLVFGLPFDVAIRLREEDDATLVDLRTVARFGDRDFGIGAGLIGDFFTALDTEMLGLGG